MKVEERFAPAEPWKESREFLNELRINEKDGSAYGSAFILFLRHASGESCHLQNCNWQSMQKKGIDFVHG